MRCFCSPGESPGGRGQEEDTGKQVGWKSSRGNENEKRGPSLETWEGQGWAEDEDNTPELFEARRRKGKRNAERSWVWDG